MEEEVKTMFDEPGDDEMEPDNSSVGDKSGEADE